MYAMQPLASPIPWDSHDVSRHIQRAQMPGYGSGFLSLLQLRPVLLRLVSVLASKLRQRIRKALARSKVTGYLSRVARSCVSARQQLTTELCILKQASASQVLKLDRSLVIA